MYIKDHKMKEFKNGKPLLNKLSFPKMKWKIKKNKNRKKIKIIKNSWFDWLINYVLNPIKNLGDFKDNIF